MYLEGPGLQACISTGSQLQVEGTCNQRALIFVHVRRLLVLTSIHICHMYLVLIQDTRNMDKWRTIPADWVMGVSLHKC